MTAISDVPVDLHPRPAYADTSNRTVAYALDLLVLSLIVFVAAAVVSRVLGPTVSFDPSAEDLSGAVSVHRGLGVVDGLVGTLLSAVYFAGSWWRGGSTPGQRLLRIHLRHDGHGSLPLRVALLRWVVLGSPFLLLSAIVVGSGPATALVWLLALAWALVLLLSTARSSIGSGLHDRVAGTVVVKMPRRVAPSVGDPG